MTLREAYTQGTKLLEQSKIPDASLDAWYLLEHITGISRALYFSDSGKEIGTDLEKSYFNLIGKRRQRIPLQHLTGVQEFMGFSFRVNKHVLIPRQDTETLVEEALFALRKKKEPLCLLDMCTGSGCILLSVMKLLCMDEGYVSVNRRKSQDWTEDFTDQRSVASNGLLVYGLGVDLSINALETAAKNAELLGIHAGFQESDLFENVTGRFSMILSNPPYIRTSEIENLQEEVRIHDPLMALDGGADGLHFYRRIIQESRDHLLPEGILMLEIGYDQASEVSELMCDAGFQNISIKRDLAGLDRVVSGVYDDNV